MGLDRLARCLIQPLHGPPLVLIVVFSLLQLVAGAAGPMGWPLSGLLAWWVWSYAYLLVDHTAHGRPPPTLSVEMVSPLHEPRPFGLVVLVGAVASLAWWCESSGLHALAIALTAASIALFPASLAVLAVEGNLARAVWPPALFGVARGLGASYPLLIVAAFAAAGALSASRGYVPVLFWYAFLQLALFVLASVLGGLLYERRDALGLDAWETPERRAGQATQRAMRERDREVDQIYALVRAREIPAALARVTALLGPAPVDPDTCRWLRDRAESWEDQRIADRLTAELVSRLLTLGRRGDAVLTLEDWWRRGRSFVAHATRDLDLLESAAAELGHEATRERLIAERAPAGSRGGPQPPPRG
jgi:hypothetical protein